MPALNGLRVLELAEGWRGPLVGALLRELGADVVKVESAAGDWLRRAWPASAAQDSDAFRLTSAGKRSVAPRGGSGSNGDGDLERTAFASEELLPLLTTADVAIVDESWDDRWSGEAGGLRQLCERLPSLVLCSVTPFGLDGAQRDWSANDFTLQACSGAMATTGFPGDPPTKAGPAIVDHTTALYAVSAILAALEERRRSGLGQLIDMAAYDCLCSYLFLFLSPLFATGAIPGRLGNRHISSAPWNSYKCRDGWVQIATSTDAQWAALARLCGRPELAQDARFSNLGNRVRHVDQVDELVTAWTCSRSMTEVLAQLGHEKLPAAPILSLARLFADPHFKQRGMLHTGHAAQGEPAWACGSIYKLSDSPVSPALTAPRLGADTTGVAADWLRRDLPSRPAARRPVRRSNAALDGIVVVEIGCFGAGPFCTRLLAELGAEVVKIEPPGGDPIRNYIPQIHGVGYPYHFYNLNKRGVSLDLKSPQQRERLLPLLARADVLVSNLAPGVIEAWGLGYETLSQRFPRLIACTISGFGRTGPYASQRAYDTTVQALSGVMSMTGRSERGPTKVGISVADLMGPTAACGAILAALYQRHATGRGQDIDLSMMDVMCWSTQAAWPTHFAVGEPSMQLGDGHPAQCPHGTFETATGLVAMAVECDEQWLALTGILGPEALALRGLGTRERLARRAQIEAMVARWARGLDADRMVRILQAHAIAAAPVMEIADVVASAQAQSRGLFIDVPDARQRSIHVIDSVFRMSRTPGRLYRGGPELGEANAAFL